MKLINITMFKHTNEKTTYENDKQVWNLIERDKSEETENMSHANNFLLFYCIHRH